MKQLKKPRRADVPRHRRVVAICGDTQVGLWMVRSLARNGLRVYCVVRSGASLAAASRYCSGAWILEHEPSSEEASLRAFADELRGLVRGVDAGSVMTISEGYHRALIACRERFEPEVHVFSPQSEAFYKATDKEYMQDLCLRLGVPVARGTTLEKLGGNGRGDLAFPLVLRTRLQNLPQVVRRAPWKAAYAHDGEQLERLREEVGDIQENILVQEYHPGAEDHVQILMHRGEAFMVGEYIGEHHMPLAGGVTVQRVSCHHGPLIRDAVRLLQALEWDGIAGVQFHYDPQTDRYIFLEINPRFIGGLPTVILAGFEAPFLYWQSHFEPHRMRRGRYRLGVRTRILGGDANWALAMLRGDELPPGQQRLGRAGTLARFAWNCLPWTRDDAMLWSDPRPALVDLREMSRRLGERSWDIIGNPERR